MTVHPPVSDVLFFWWTVKALGMHQSNYAFKILISIFIQTNKAKIPPKPPKFQVSLPHILENKLVQFDLYTVLIWTTAMPVHSGCNLKNSNTSKNATAKEGRKIAPCIKMAGSRLQQGLQWLKKIPEHLVSSDHNNTLGFGMFYEYGCNLSSFKEIGRGWKDSKELPVWEKIPSCIRQIRYLARLTTQNRNKGVKDYNKVQNFET